jgi:hypothetical protein
MSTSTLTVVQKSTLTSILAIRVLGTTTCTTWSDVPEALNRIVDKVLAYRPKPKTKAARKRQRLKVKKEKDKKPT